MRQIDEKMIIKYESNNWELVKPPTVSIITPYYNRSKVLGRALESVRNLSYRDFEYIIIDDGSEDGCDGMVNEYMNSVDFPVLFIKKDNGGVHTARNAGVRMSRGRYIIFLDSDDEFKPDALESLIYTWKEVYSFQDSGEYFEVKARCEDQNGNEVGSRFPDDINSLPYHRAVHLYERMKGEHIGMRDGEIMRRNLWPEPQGITFVSEDIVWCKLRKQYKSYFINDIVRIYHRESEDSLERSVKRTKQTCMNTLWNITYMLNNWKWYRNKYRKQYVKYIVMYGMLHKILRNDKKEFDECRLIRLNDRLLSAVFYFPSFIFSTLYSRRIYG